MPDYVIAGIILLVIPVTLVGLSNFKIEIFFYSSFGNKFDHLPMIIGAFILALIGALAGGVYGFFAGITWKFIIFGAYVSIQSTWNFIIVGAFVGVITMILIALGARDCGDGVLGIILIGAVGGGVWGYNSILLSQLLISYPVYILVTIVVIICIVGFVLLLVNQKNKHRFFSTVDIEIKAL